MKRKTYHENHEERIFNIHLQNDSEKANNHAFLPLNVSKKK